MNLKNELYKVDWSIEGIVKTLVYYTAVSLSFLIDYVEIKDKILVAVLIALILDTVLGSAKAKKLGIKPTSREGWRGLQAKLLGLLLVGGVGAILKLLGFSIGIFINSILVILVVYEVYSAVGNFYTMRTGIKVKEYDAVSIVLKLVLDKLKAIGDVLIKKNKQKDDTE